MVASQKPKSPKPFDPSRLDVAALAEDGRLLQGDAPLESLARLADPGEPPVAVGAAFQWQAKAERRPVRGAAPELWLHLQAQAEVPRTCQRCLQPVAVQLVVRRDYLFAPSEAQAQVWDVERDDADVLVLGKSMNLLELIEDELILELPLVPRHDACPEALMAAPGPEKGDHPFAGLARLRRSR